METQFIKVSGNAATVAFTSWYSLAFKLQQKREISLLALLSCGISQELLACIVAAPYGFLFMLLIQYTHRLISAGCFGALLDCF